ncbi:MAG: nucleotidyltransferase substrate binding protein [Planctomycetes bacterium]|nr:nucleotidyltransferase substrate binding protein [Planctomycetota bacterium]
MDVFEIKKVLSQLENALQKFTEALAHDIKKDELYLDGTIQRFEFSFELCWKVLKRCLEYEGVSARTPREVFKEAFKLGWLTEGDQHWLKMIDDRNLTCHTYNQSTALALYSRLPGYLQSFRRLLSFLNARYP